MVQYYRKLLRFIPPAKIFKKIFIFAHYKVARRYLHISNFHKRNTGNFNILKATFLKKPMHPNKFKWYGNLPKVFQEMWTPISYQYSAARKGNKL